MISGDYKERKRVNKKGVQVTDKIVTSTSGTEYLIGGKMGAGGVARVFRAKRLRDGKKFAFKEYLPSPELAKIHRNIKRNVQKLISNPILDDDGKPLKSFVMPVEIVELPASHSFGYVMEVVDTSNYIPLKKLWRDYPDARIMCRLCKNIAHLFTRLHLGTGWCYKDINEDNIYIDPGTGDFYIIDCDNISVPKTKTISGTPGYMAPEVYVNHMPDTRTDQFSMAVFFYRLLVGGYPMEGKKTQDYLKSTNQAVQDAAAVIYGSDALFTFDPVDPANTIRGLVDENSEKNTKVYQLQTKMWDYLPDEVKQCFYKTFSEGLPDAKRAIRTTDKIWYDTFDAIEKEGLVKCSCGNYAFGSHRPGKICPYCNQKLPLLPKAAGSVHTPVRKSASVLPSRPVRQKELTKAVFRATRNVEPKHLTVTAERKGEMRGSQIHPQFSNRNLMRIEYSAKRSALSAVNLSVFTWSVSQDGVKSICPPGKRVILTPGCVLTIQHRQLQLKVMELK